MKSFDRLEKALTELGNLGKDSRFGERFQFAGVEYVHLLTLGSDHRFDWVLAADPNLPLPAAPSVVVRLREENQE